MNLSRILPLALLSTWAVAEPHPAEVPVVRAPVLRSADYREDAQYQVTVGLGGVAPYLGFSLNAGIFLKPDELLSFSYLSGVESEDFTRNLFSGHEDDTEARMLSVGYKRFLGNSLYAEASGFARRLRQSTYEYHSAYNHEVLRVYEMDSFGGALVLGSQWQWPTFTLGCDWGGLLVPLARGKMKTSIKSQTTSSYMESDRKDLENSAVYTQAIALRFYLGYTF